MRQPHETPALTPAALLIAGALLTGCPGTLPGKECFQQEDCAAAVLVQNCTAGACHGAEDAAYGLDLETRGAGPRIKGKASFACNGLALIEPGKPEQSALYLKLFDPPPCGSRMPLGRPELDPADIEVLRVWIAGMDGSCETGATGSGGGGGAGGSAATSATTESTTTTSEGGSGGGGGG
jgi:hypothetical protein